MSEQASDQTSVETKPGTGEEQTTESGAQSSPANPPEGYVSKAELDRVLADMHRYKSSQRELETKLRQTEESKLREKEDWKGLLALKEREADEAVKERDLLKNSFVSEKKYSAVKSEAMKLGIRAEALQDLEMLDLNDVIIETTSTGRYNVLGADSFIKNLKALRPHWFGGTSTKVDSSLPDIRNNAHSGISPRELIKLSQDAAKSGDYTAYREAMKRYQNQN